MKVTLLTVSQSCAYCATHTDELKADAQKAGVDLTVVVNEFDAGVQAQQVNQVISTKPDAVILWAADATAILPSLARLKSAKIPVVLTNTHPQTDDTSLWTAYTGPDDTDYGRKAGEAMVTALKAKGQTSGSVVVVTGVPGTPGAINRLKGFTETLEKDAPQVTIAGTQNADWDQTKGTTAAAALLTLYGKDDLVGIYAEADNMLAGAIVAADRAGYKPGDLTMVGSNCSIEGYTNIESGAQQASVLLSPYDDASLAWQATLKVLQGDDVANETFIPPVVITNLNLADCAAAVDK
ncbi:sugar ABC transporter substrate-binding protein [Subtercola boreus]|nr:sugar ABC transporter substrate-binding protein [Subtercola boreus]